MGESVVGRKASFWGAAMLPALLCFASGAAICAPAAAPLSLHDRILQKHDGASDPDPAVEMRNVRAMEVEARADPGLSIDDRAMVQANIGYALAANRDHAAALALIDGGVAMLVKAGHGETPLALEMMMNAAAEAGDAGDRDDADRRLNHVKDVQARVMGPDSDDVGTTMNHIGYNAMRQGRLAYAIDNVQGALARMKPGPGTRAAFISNYATLSTALLDAGRVDESLAAARTGAALAERDLPPAHIGIGVTLNNLAASLNGTGRFAEGETVARRALDVHIRYRGKNSPTVVAAMNTLAFSLAGQGRTFEAETLYLAAADLFDGMSDTVAPKTPVTLLLNAADLARARGDNEAADARIARAFMYLAKPTKGDERLRARANAAKALGLLVGGHADLALPLSEAALAGLADLPPAQLQRADAETLHGLILTRLGRAAEAYRATAPIAAAIETALLDSAVPGGELRNLGPYYARGFNRLTVIALAAGQPEAALKAAQLANLSGLAITDSAVAARSAAGDPAVAALVRQVQDFGTARVRLDRERSYALGKSATEVKRLDAAIAETDRAVESASALLDTRFPLFRTLSRPSPVGLAAATAALTPSAALLMPVAIDDGAAAIMLTHKGLAWAPTPLSAGALAAAVQRVRAGIDSGDETALFAAADAYQLYRNILPAALAAQLPSKADLQIFGGGALARLPIGLLLTAPPKSAALRPADFRNAPWLIRQHSVEVVAGLGGRRDPDASVRAASFAGIGAPRLAEERPFDAPAQRVLRGGALDAASLRSLPSLPGAARELEAIRTALRPKASVMLIGKDATETRLMATDLSRYRVVAFATHGLIGNGVLGEPALVLTPPVTATARDDGLLTASEASTLRLDAEWVVLSGCDSAGAEAEAAPVYSGLARAFFQAGGRSLLVSMWRVRDDIAARLTVATLAGSRTMSKPQALRQAELALLADRSAGAANPALWAPFTLLER
jgi:CHAT domain-containing protein